jgi:hypothetical protein
MPLPRATQQVLVHPASRITVVSAGEIRDDARILSARSVARSRASKQKAAVSDALPHGRYRARTSDPAVRPPACVLHAPVSSFMLSFTALTEDMPAA